MKHFFLLLMAASFLSLPHAFAKDSAQEKPNVLFIAVDDLNDWIGCLKTHPQAHTPNIDALASRGTLFTNAHCQAPLCNPSRASLLTGLRPSTTGIYGLAPGIRAVEATKNRVTLPQYFAKHGYFTAGFGKIFHDGSIAKNEQDKEFDVWGIAPPIPLPDKKLVNTPSDLRAMDWGIFPADDREQADWKIADAAINQLKNAPQGKPFFIAAGFRLPHVPCFASQKWFDLIGPEEKIILPNVLRNDRADLPFFAWYLHWKLPEPRLSWLEKANQWRNLTRAYLASTAFMDSQVGRLLEALEKSGKRENTIIVLWSDHGWHLGEKGITGKNSLWNRSTHVPLIFAGPRVTKNARCNQPAELLDLYPTLVDLCDLPPQSGLEGHSLSPQLQNSAAPRRFPAITTHNVGNDSVRSERWRYIRYANGSQELYDEQNDPNEWRNLASESRYAKVIHNLARWLPKSAALPAPGSAQRVLWQENGAWIWEGKAINPAELED